MALAVVNPTQMPVYIMHMVAFTVRKYVLLGVIEAPLLCLTPLEMSLINQNDLKLNSNAWKKQ